MGQLLPDRHPHRDFFILDVADAAPKDDMASMEHPVFSLSSKPDMRELVYDLGEGARLRVVPSGRGLATIMDKDVLLYAISKLVHELNGGAEITPWVEMSAHEVMVATNWRTNRESYQRFEDALVRLKGTVILTDIATADHVQTRGFGLIEAFEIDRKERGAPSPFGRMTRVRVKVSDWTFRAVKGMEVLTINPRYFRLRRPLERRIYELARKHGGDPRPGRAGRSASFRIGIGRLQQKVGSNAPAKKFRYFLKEIIRDGHVPDYRIALDGDIVTFEPVAAPGGLFAGRLPLKPATLDKAQEIAAGKGIALAAIEAEWNEWLRETGRVPDRPDAAFLGFCRQKAPARQARLFEDWH